MNSVIQSQLRWKFFTLFRVQAASWDTNDAEMSQFSPHFSRSSLGNTHRWRSHSMHSAINCIWHQITRVVSVQPPPRGHLMPHHLYPTPIQSKYCPLLAKFCSGTAKNNLKPNWRRISLRPRYFYITRLFFYFAREGIMVESLSFCPITCPTNYQFHHNLSRIFQILHAARWFVIILPVDFHCKVVDCFHYFFISV